MHAAKVQSVERVISEMRPSIFMQMGRARCFGLSLFHNLISNSNLMRIVKACLLLPVFLLAPASAQNPVDQVIAEALKPSPLEKNLQQLTDQVGGRVPGTLAMRQAVDWGVAAFKAAGADSVYTENFTIAASWGEGFTRMSISAPEKFDVRVVSMGWAPALGAHQDVPVVDVAEGRPEDFVKAGNVSWCFAAGALPRDGQMG